MAEFCVRWGDDVQPYVMQLASEHIETLRAYCEQAIARILKSRKRKRRVLAVTARVNKGMLKAKAFHRFQMFGFDFELREDASTEARKREFVLNFTKPPAFRPEDMPPRLRRVEGKPISALPTKKKKRRKAAAPRPAHAGRRKSVRKRRVERVLYRLRPIIKWTQTRGVALLSSLTAKLYKMYDLNQRLSAQVAIMWRRRPRFEFSLPTGSSLISVREPEYAPVRARLEPRLIGESLRVLLFTFVSRERAALWDASLFGELPDEGERIAV